MSNKGVGAVVARAAGVVLLVIAGSSFFSWPWLYESAGMGVSGWTSYSPLATNTFPAADLTTQLHDTYYIAASSLGFWLPSVAQGVAGLIMILFSRAIGGWLAGGLTDDVTPTDT